ncbi:hypothetical protein KIPB_009623 [Kipferlia bialata]|uniref:Uncharacterized protein n=1 Tax=Kipferlia bialata TaxID=797122 RepID=A0A9K3D3I5_9EUKA|nr:hypothetical protein KIPB_009623 [Kipferlia bialata]|eukprot:g9623.t1
MVSLFVVSATTTPHIQSLLPLRYIEFSIPVEYIPVEHFKAKGKDVACPNITSTNVYRSLFWDSPNRVVCAHTKQGRYPAKPVVITVPRALTTPPVLGDGCVRTFPWEVGGDYHERVMGTHTTSHFQVVGPRLYAVNQNELKQKKLLWKRMNTFTYRPRRYGMADLMASIGLNVPMALLEDEEPNRGPQPQSSPPRSQSFFSLDGDLFLMEPNAADATRGHSLDLWRYDADYSQSREDPFDPWSAMEAPPFAHIKGTLKCVVVGDRMYTAGWVDKGVGKGVACLFSYQAGPKPTHDVWSEWVDYDVEQVRLSEGTLVQGTWVCESPLPEVMLEWNAKEVEWQVIGRYLAALYRPSNGVPGTLHVPAVFDTVTHTWTTDKEGVRALWGDMSEIEYTTQSEINNQLPNVTVVRRGDRTRVQVMQVGQGYD